jgi:ribosome biogenesis GTPase
MLARVLKSTGNWYNVKAENGLYYRCRIRGKLRTKGLKTTNPVAAGDFVVIEVEEDEEGNIASILEIQKRKNYIIRKSVNLSKEAQVVAANVDMAFLVITTLRPQTTTGFIDRFLVAANAYDIPVTLLFHKWDQYSEKERSNANDLIQLYRSIGYAVVKTSLESMEGIPDLTQLMIGKTVLFSGHSGVGKSSLIQHFIPSIELRVGEISDWSEKGQHTTTFAEVFEWEDKGFIIDTPGIKGFGLVDIPKEEIGLYFPEMFAKLPECKFNSCQHLEEPNCAVRQAVMAGEIPQFRYDNYRSMLLDDDAKSPYRSI